jgi:hypothetical protein
MTTTNLIERLEDAAYEWANYVVEDTAPRTLNNHLTPHIKALADTIEAQAKQIENFCLDYRNQSDATNKKLHAQIEGLTDSFTSTLEILKERDEQIEALQDDADSLDWLEIHGGDAMLKKYDVWTYQRHSLADIERFESLRAAIDAARKGQQ